MLQYDIMIVFLFGMFNPAVVVNVGYVPELCTASIYMADDACKHKSSRRRQHFPQPHGTTTQVRN
jgi:hypothetical protein